MATSKNIPPNYALAGGRTALSVNVNKVALLRNTRALGIPSVLRAAQLCLMAGASGITVHPRPDERHIKQHDVHELAAMMGDWPGREFNIEGNPFHNLMEFVRELKPDQATLVPDSADQSTSDHGWSFPADAARLRPIIDECHTLGVRVSQPACRLNHTLDRLLDRQRSVFLHQLRQVVTLDKLHDEEVRPLGLVGIKRRDDVRVSQLRDRFYLAVKPFHRAGRFHPRPRHHLQRDEPLHQLVLGLEHHPHAALTELVENDIVAQR